MQLARGSGRPTSLSAQIVIHFVCLFLFVFLALTTHALDFTRRFHASILYPTHTLPCIHILKALSSMTYKITLHENR